MCLMQVIATYMSLFHCFTKCVLDLYILCTIHILQFKKFPVFFLSLYSCFFVILYLNVIYFITKQVILFYYFTQQVFLDSLWKCRYVYPIICFVLIYTFVPTLPVQFYILNCTYLQILLSVLCIKANNNRKNILRSNVKFVMYLNCILYVNFLKCQLK